MKLPPCVAVWWDDHTSQDDWQTVSGLSLTEAKILSVGFLVKEDEKRLWLAGGLNVEKDEDGCTNLQCILKSTVTARKTIKVPHGHKLEQSSGGGRPSRTRRRKRIRSR